MNADSFAQDDPNRESPSALHESGGAPDSSRAREQANASFSVQRVLLGVLALVLVGGAGAGAWWYFAMREPSIYPLRGVAWLDGEPMTEGVVMTEYMDRSDLLGGMAGIGKDGRFEMATEGQPGVYAGEHKILVMLMSGGFPPVSLIPEKYGSKDQTPFSIVVDAETGTTPLKLELFGRKQSPARRDGGNSGRTPSDAQDGSEAPGSLEVDGAEPRDGAPRVRR